MACKLKRAQIFFLSIKNLKYQVVKEVRLGTNPKNNISEKYYIFLDVFSKKEFDMLPFYQKYHHKIILEE